MKPKKTETRSLSRAETHDLSMIIKDRTKVLKAHVEAQKATCMADFEAKLAAVYSFDQDAVWKTATQEAMKIVGESQKKIEKRCEELGIPKAFAPSIAATWSGRGENALADRRAELRRVAKSSIEAMGTAAVVKIEQQSLDLRTQVVAMGLLSPEAKVFLESMQPVEEAMRKLDFAEIESKLALQKAEHKRLGFYA